MREIAKIANDDYLSLCIVVRIEVADRVEVERGV